MISERQKAFDQNGFFVFSNLLTVAELAELRSATDEAVKNRIAPILFEDATDLEYESVPELYRQDGKIFRRLNGILQRGGIYRELLEGPIKKAVLSVFPSPVQVCLNRHNMLLLKAPRNPAPVLWHQDAGVWNEGTFRHKALILALDDFQADNGPLEVIPGSHRDSPIGLPWKEHVARVAEVHGEKIARSRTKLLLRAGDAVLFDGLLLHGSEGNHSDVSRRTLTLAFYPGDLTRESRRGGSESEWMSGLHPDAKPVVFSLDA